MDCADLNGTTNENQSYLENDKTYQKFSLIINGFLVCTVVIAGLMGNFIIVIILRKQSEKVKIHAYLQVIACWDSLLLAASWILYSYPAFAYGVQPSTGKYVYCYILLHPLSNIAKVASIWTLLVAGKERQFAVTQPLKYQTTYNRSTAKYILMFISLLAVVVNLPRFFEIEVIHCTVPSNKVQTPEIPPILPSSVQLEPTVRASALYHNSVYFLLYTVAFDLIFLTVGPFVVQAFLSVLIIIAVRRSYGAQGLRVISKAKTSTCSGDFKGSRSTIATILYPEDKMTLIFVAILVKGIICSMLPNVVNLVELVYRSADLRQHLNDTGFFTYLVDWSNVMAMLNCAVNIFIFGTISTVFRTETLHWLTCGRLDTGCHLSKGDRLLLRQFDQDATLAVRRKLIVSPGSDAMSPLNAAADELSPMIERTHFV